MDSVRIIDVFRPDDQNPGREVKNILILALSTMSFKRPEPGDNVNANIWKPSTAKCRIKGREMPEESYYYQLEPIPMMLTGYLKKTGGQIDEVIMICSKNVWAKKIKGIRLQGVSDTEAENAVYLKGAGENDPGVSARDYFVSFMKKYLSDKLSGGGRYEDPYFYEVDYENVDDFDEQSRLIGDIISEIRKRNSKNDLEIYIDTHGGPRSYQDVVNGMLSLLRLEGISIKPENIFSVMYLDGVCEIVPSRLTMDILDFVSGMTELTNYARTDTLTRFLDSAGADENDRKLIDTAKGIAEGMQFCNVSEFESRLDELTELMKTNEEKADGKTGLLDIFTETIRNNYKGLLVENRTVPDEIRWCLEKGFYQQTLTLIEGRMARYLNENGIFLYEPEVGGVGNNLRGDFELNNSLFNNVTPSVFPSINTESDDKKKTAEKLKIFSGGKIPVDDVVCRKLDYLNIEIRVTGDNAKDFLRLHCGLKTLRNISNHAADGQSFTIGAEIFVNKVNEYLDIVQKMEEAVISGIKEGIYISAAVHDLVFCTTWDDNNQDPQLKKYVRNYPDYVRIGPTMPAPNDPQKKIASAADKTASKIIKCRAPLVLLDPHRAEPAEYEEMFWDMVAKILTGKGIKVQITKYQKSGIGTGKNGKKSHDIYTGIQNYKIH